MIAEEKQAYISTLRQYTTVDSRRIKGEAWAKPTEGIWSLLTKADKLIDSIYSPTTTLYRPQRAIYDRVTSLIPNA